MAQNESVLRSTIKKVLLIAAVGIVILGIVNMIIVASNSKGAGVASALFGGLMEVCAYACIPGGLYAILIGQDMLMRHQGIQIPTAPQRPQQPQQQYQNQQYQAQQPQQYQAQQQYPNQQYQNQQYNQGQNPGNYQ